MEKQHTLDPHLNISHRHAYLRGAVSRHEKMFTFHSTPLPWSTFSETPDYIGTLVFIFSYEPEDAGNVERLATLARTGLL